MTDSTLADEVARLLARYNASEAKPKRREPSVRRIVDHVTEDEYRSILRVIDTRYPSGKRNQAMLVTLWHTGLRIGELLSLEPSAWDLQAREVKVRTSKTAAGVRIVTLPRADSMDGVELDHALEVWEQVRPESAWYFCTGKGTKIYAHALQRTVRLYVKRAGIERRITPHMFRHAFATRQLAAGRPVAHVSGDLGHSSPEVTYRSYAHATVYERHQTR